jgi:hypothetical protein
MSDHHEKNVSTLAVSEKKSHRPGCVGIFFQLFDWNRRFAKKKLFSRKLLPPGRSKQGSKKFCVDEKLPNKLRLIADENSGGFPNAKKDDFEQKRSMRPPSLVAKLMGLESMPAVKPDRLEKSLPPSQEKFASDHHLEFHNENWIMQKRPQKLQRTGSCERRPVAILGTEAFQLRNVLSRPKKHHSKLSTPVKSPKNLSARNASRLLGVATKILEPGLQANNRAKCAITYTKPAHHVSFDEAILSKLEGQSSCQNCVYSIPCMDTRPKTEEYSSVFSSYAPDYEDPSSKPRIPIYPLDQEQERPIFNKLHFDEEIRLHQHTKVPQCKSQRDRVRQRSRSGNLQEKAVINETKNFVALNRTLSGQTRSRTTVKSENLSKIFKKGDEILSPVRKRRSMNVVSRQNEHFDLEKQKEMNRNASGKKGKDVITFARDSPMKQRRRDQSNPNCNKYPHKNSSTFSKKSVPFREDPLGKILEQKLKELNFQEINEFGLARTPPKRTSAVILQELIAALHAERPHYQNNIAAKSTTDKPNMIKNIAFEPQVNQNIAQGKNNNLSPGSVLEASFSNDSCVSSSFDESSGHVLCSDIVNYPDFCDSANSLCNKKTCRYFVIHLIRQISEALQGLDFLDSKSDKIKISHAKEVILNSELMFKTQDFSILQFLNDELESLASVICTNLSSFLKDGNLLRVFSFDCLIEYLESKCEFTKLPLPMNEEVIKCEVAAEVRRWAGFPGLLTDELVDKDMCFKLGKWIDFEIEEFEIGDEISSIIFDELVDDIVIELCKCKKIVHSS